MNSSTASGTRPLRGALIGFGFIGSLGHAPGYLGRADVEIVAVADSCEARRKRASEVLPTARLYHSHGELLAAEAKNLDFVDICTPPCDHATIAHEALDAGLHVLCEKPLTTSLDEASALLAHAQSAERVLFPCHNYKHAPVVRAIREVIASGRLGEVRSVTLNTFRNTHAKGVPEWNPHWRRQSRYSGGGITMDHGSHTFYLAFEWLGAYPTAVSAKLSNLESGRYDTEDNAAIVLTFPTGLATAQLTWTAGVRKVIYAVQGTTGAVTVDDDDLQIATMHRTLGPDVAQGAVDWKVERRSIASHWGDASHATWFGALFDQFKGAIARSEFVGKEALDAYRCVEVIMTAYQSAAEGCREIALPSARRLRDSSQLVLG
jgi:predicted dehydrogenase